MTEPAQTARAVVFSPNHQLLLMERRKQGRHYFTLPGGHVEPQETPSACLVFAQSTRGPDDISDWVLDNCSMICRI